MRSDEQPPQRAIHQHETMRWTRLLPPVVVVDAAASRSSIPVAVPSICGATSLEWTVTLENGEHARGHGALDKLDR